ncbi:MAG: NADPH-dependent FMN reductase [Chlamydiales bacterium]
MKKLPLLFIAFFNLVFVPLYSELKVLAFSGSSREGSYNQELAEFAAHLAKSQGAIVTVVNLGDFGMPLYHADEEARRGMPESVKSFRQLLLNHDRIIIASPEYNGSITALLKNALDWASRSEDGKPSNAAFKDKKFAIMSASPGKGGGCRGLEHLQQILANLGAKVITCKVSVPQASSAFDKRGKLVSPQMTQLLQQEINLLLQ